MRSLDPPKAFTLIPGGDSVVERIQRKIMEWADQLQKYIDDTLRRPVWGSFEHNQASIAANTTVDAVITVTGTTGVDSGPSKDKRGIATGMALFVTPPSNLTAGIHCRAAWVSAENQITLRLVNTTAGALNPPVGTWQYLAWDVAAR